MLNQFPFEFATNGQGLYNLTQDISGLVAATTIVTGLCHVFIHHTSASLIITENADPKVQEDLETFMRKIVPQDINLYKHIEEGVDDMPSHIRCVLTSSFLTIPIHNAKFALGNWQGIFLWEHRVESHLRKLTITVLGE